VCISLNAAPIRFAPTLPLLPLLILSTMSLASCSGQAPPPERAIAALVEQAQDAGEAGDVDGLLALLSGEYRDIDGRDRRAVGFLLRMLFARYPDSVVLVRDLEVEVISEELANAGMQLFVVARDQASGSGLDFDGERLWMRLALRLESGDWRVTRAQWRRQPWN